MSSKSLFRVTANAKVVVNLCLYHDVHSELIAKITVAGNSENSLIDQSELKERIEQQNFLAGIVIQPSRIESIEQISWDVPVNSPHLRFSYEDEHRGETDCYLPKKLVKAIGEEATFEVVIGEDPRYLIDACDEEVYNKKGVEWENIIDEWLAEPWTTHDRPIVLVLVKLTGDSYEIRVGEVDEDTQTKATFPFEADSETAGILLKSTEEKLKAMGHTIQYCIKV